MTREDYLKNIPFAPDWIANPPPEIKKGSAKRGNLEVALTHRDDESSSHARAVLDKLSDELAHKTRGGRNDSLNRIAFTMGGFIGSGAIERAEVEAALTSVCHRNGLVKDDGISSVEKTIISGIGSGMERPFAPEDAAISDEDIDPPIGAAPATRKHEKFRVTWFNDIEDNAQKEWVVEGFIAAGEFSYAVGKPGSGRAPFSRTRLVTSALAWIGTAAR